MVTLQEKAYAKLNLTLDVLGKRQDGYHDLKSVMQTVSLFDNIEIDVDTGKPWTIRCNVEGIPCDERNLVWKAARAYFDVIGKEPDGIEIRIEKRIPSGAGMGGGSADAAAVLRILNRYYNSPLSLSELTDVGAKLGSDVPFCVVGGTVMCEGRGEILRKLPDMPDCIFLGCKPEFSISTPALYKELDETTVSCHPDNDAMEHAICSGDLPGIAKQISNVFDPVVSAQRPEIDHIKGICQFYGAMAVQMTGSGSVVFAVMPDRSSAQKAEAELKNYYSQVFIARPV